MAGNSVCLHGEFKAHSCRALFAAVTAFVFDICYSTVLVTSRALTWLGIGLHSDQLDVRLEIPCCHLLSFSSICRVLVSFQYKTLTQIFNRTGFVLLLVFCFCRVEELHVVCTRKTYTRVGRRV